MGGGWGVVGLGSRGEKRAGNGRKVRQVSLFGNRFSTQRLLFPGRVGIFFFFWYLQDGKRQFGAVAAAFHKLFCSHFGDLDTEEEGKAETKHEFH